MVVAAPCESPPAEEAEGQEEGGEEADHPEYRQGGCNTNIAQINPGHQFDGIRSVPLAIRSPLHRRGEQVLDFCWVLADKLLFESFLSCCQICPNVFVHPFY